MADILEQPRRRVERVLKLSKLSRSLIPAGLSGLGARTSIRLWQPDAGSRLAHCRNRRCHEAAWDAGDGLRRRESATIWPVLDSDREPSQESRRRAGGSQAHGTSMDWNQIFLEHLETIDRAAAHACRRY